MHRRDLLRLTAYSAGALALSRSVAAEPGRPAPPIIDTHIHLFDTSRPGGVPWPEKSDTALYKPALPSRYQELSAPFGVVGAIAVEASPLATDNDWLLNVVESNPFMVGMVGDLIPGDASFHAALDRLHRNPLFLGIRYGNLWNRDLEGDLNKPGFIDGLKALAQAGLVLDSANPDLGLIHALLRVSDEVPNLRIVIDHLPNMKISPGPTQLKEYLTFLPQLAQNPNVFIKLSEIPVLRDGKLITDPAFYRDHLADLWTVFGEDHILFGSDWPNSDHVAPYADTLSIVRTYIAGKSPAAAEKYYWMNSVAAYRWRPRTASQPRP